MKSLSLADKTAGPYPVDQVDHIIRIRQQQDLGEPLKSHSLQASNERGFEDVSTNQLLPWLEAPPRAADLSTIQRRW